MPLNQFVDFRQARTIVTGFGPFGAIVENPSMRLAQGCGRTFHILEVAYAAVDQFLGELDSGSFDVIMMLGVADSSQKMRVETTARNWIGPVPDVRGYAPGPRVIAIDMAPQIHRSTRVNVPGNDYWQLSHDAGEYLCNYILFQALRRFERKCVCFIHVPPFREIPEAIQAVELARFLNDIEERAYESN